MTQKMNNCKEKMKAKMVINGHEDEESSALIFTTVVAFGDILKTITETDQINIPSLLNAKAFTAKYNGYYLLTSVSRD